MMRRRGWIIGGVALVMLASVQVGVAQAGTRGGSSACHARDNNTIRKLLECVTLDGVREHQAALALIARFSGGNRFSGLPGHDRSVAYVVARLRLAGYHPTVQPFDYTASTPVGPSTLRQTAPGTATYVDGTDFQAMDQTDPGNVTAPVTAVDVVLAPPRAPVTSGCEGAFATDPATGETVPDPGGPSDFDSFPAGDIALIQRGTCTFETKAANAAAAGAVGVILFNQGNTPAREGLTDGSLGATNVSGIPVIDATFALGQELATTPGLQVHMFANVVRATRKTYNVFAETKSGDDSNVVMVGAHLDSVFGGPGINDDGSGSAAILEVALQMKRVKPTNTVRFAWWGAEESGLVGSDLYVNGLTDAERAKIALYLNFDMIGSPNFVRFVYDGSGDAFGLPGPEGSAAIEDLFTTFYADRGLASEPTQINFRSDYAAFFDHGIPFGGAFTGADGGKTPAQAATYGGTAGQQYDPCYHEACDTFANVNGPVLDLNADAVAFATLTYAMSTASVEAGAAAMASRRPNGTSVRPSATTS